MDVALITAVYDGYDTLKPIEPQVFLDPCRHVVAVCVTDDPSLEVPGWTMVVDPREGVHPNLAAKRPKMLPWEYVGDVAGSVWIDAAFRVTSPRFVDQAVAMAHPIAQFVHPWRSCAYDEARASLELPKYAGLPLGAQVDSYRGELPNRWGLWATGCIARMHTPEVMAFGADWLAECEQWGYQDQLSETVALRRAGLRPAPLPGDHLSNPWLVHEASARH